MKNAQKSSKNMSFAIFVPRGLQSIKNCFGTYIGGSDTTFPHQHHRFFENLTKNFDPGVGKKIENQKI